MAYRRKRTTRVSKSKRKMYPSRKRRVQKNVVAIKKKLISSVIAANGPFADIYRPTDLPEWKQYADLFEQYKLTAVKVQLYPQEVVNMTASSGTNFVIPTITMAIDQTDNNTLFTEPDLLSRFDAKTMLFNKPITKYFRVKPSVEPVSEIGEPQPVWKNNSFWLATKRDITDDSYDDTPHLGFKYYIGNGGGSSQQTYFRKVTTYYLVVKNPRTGRA